jgi:hypothetical protein
MPAEEPTPSGPPEPTGTKLNLHKMNPHNP